MEPASPSPAGRNERYARQSMITITSFYPFENFLRTTHEFHDDKAVVKMKSLTYERDYEFDYKELDEIYDKYHANEYQISFGIVVLTLLTFALLLFYNNIYAQPVLLGTVRMFFVCGFIIFISGFKKNWQIRFSDNKDNLLTYIQQTSKNAELISHATELIRSRVGEIRETTAADPFPDEKPIYERDEYDVGRFNKIVEKFYYDRIITFQRTLFYEVAFSTMYSQFSGKVYRGKVSAIPWFSYFCNLLYIGFIFLGIELAFDIGMEVDFLFFLRVLLFLFIICWLLSFLKKEVVGLYDNDKNLTYSTFINRENKDKIEEIIEFIRSKIPAEEKQ